MTETVELTVISEALAVVDRGLGTMRSRELVTTAEVSDLLLDLRSILIAGTVVESPPVPADPAPLAN